jgi:predicted nucleic-acid-binding Zn-ribbon protein
MHIDNAMAQTEFNNCPKCGIGKLKPTGGAAVRNDPQTSKETGFYREYKCNNCGYPEGGHAKVFGVNEKL